MVSLNKEAEVHHCTCLEGRHRATTKARVLAAESNPCAFRYVEHARNAIDKPLSTARLEGGSGVRPSARPRAVHSDAHTTVQRSTPRDNSEVTVSLVAPIGPRSLLRASAHVAASMIRNTLKHLENWKSCVQISR